MPEKTRAALGGCQRFECRVIGYPRPTIQWFKDGRNITKDDRYEFDYSIDGIITMVICNVTEKDQGVYSCRAENSEGWAATAASLNVRDSGSGGIRTHASEETGALNQRLRPLGHAT
uniref:Myosin light chain kinase, smooth muscle n=1 Tax=Magallana gigas TaxID=29159 RepID=K1QN95_MAGGI